MVQYYYFSIFINMKIEEIERVDEDQIEKNKLSLTEKTHIGISGAIVLGLIVGWVIVIISFPGLNQE
jgi:hypothetical protein